MKHSSCYFQNKDCGYFPCHKVSDSSYFNCLFCYCPLYALGDKCGGNCTYTENGIKDCSNCLIPHSPKGYDYINERFNLLAELAKENRKKD
jgi:Zn-finger protein